MRCSGRSFASSRTSGEWIPLHSRAAAAHDFPVESTSFQVGADVALRGDRIVALGHLADATAKRVVDATGMIVSPGFIDMLGQSEYSLLIDNRCLSKLSQGITSEITGEGASIAPQTELTLAPMKPSLDQYKLNVDWTDLAGYFERLRKAGTPINIGTYVGAAQVRAAVVGNANRVPTAAELEKMKSLVADAMQQGAMGISTALIYPPGHYAKTDELIELAKVAGKFGGIYATHLRSEGQSEMQALDEAIRKMTSLPAQRVHLPARGLLKTGFYADITIFNPAEIVDTATFDVPNQVSKGVEYVFVNGQLAYEHGKLTGVNSGCVLEGPGATH